VQTCRGGGARGARRPRLLLRGHHGERVSHSRGANHILAWFFAQWKIDIASAPSTCFGRGVDVCVACVLLYVFGAAANGVTSHSGCVPAIAISGARCQPRVDAHAARCVCCMWHSVVCGVLRAHEGRAGDTLACNARITALTVASGACHLARPSALAVALALATGKG
jgi:hypothetical protein